ncbi:MAG: hypothetical protein ABR543_18285 [Gemmatimonadaceae bacterium]
MHDSPRVPLADPLVPPEGAEDVFARFVIERGKVPNLFRAVARHPAILTSLEAHMRAVMGPGDVPQLLKELLSVRVSHINLCDY